MATIKHLSSKNSNYAAAESYLTFQHNEYTGLPILDEKGRPKLRDSYLLDTLECGDFYLCRTCSVSQWSFIFYFIDSAHANVLNHIEIVEILLSEGHPEACQLD